MEHEAQPHQGDQHQLIEKEVGDHGKIPSYRWRNEGILPGFAGYRISRKIEVQDPPNGNRNMVVGCRGACPSVATISGRTTTPRAMKSPDPVPRAPETGHVPCHSRSSRAMKGMSMVGALSCSTGCPAAHKGAKAKR